MVLPPRLPRGPLRKAGEGVVDRHLVLQHRLAHLSLQEILEIPVRLDLLDHLVRSRRRLVRHQSRRRLHCLAILGLLGHRLQDRSRRLAHRRSRRLLAHLGILVRVRRSRQAHRQSRRRTLLTHSGILLLGGRLVHHLSRRRQG